MNIAPKISSIAALAHGMLAALLLSGCGKQGSPAIQLPDDPRPAASALPADAPEGRNLVAFIIPFPGNLGGDILEKACEASVTPAIAMLKSSGKCAELFISPETKFDAGFISDRATLPLLAGKLAFAQAPGPADSLPQSDRKVWRGPLAYKAFPERRASGVRASSDTAEGAAKWISANVSPANGRVSIVVELIDAALCEKPESPGDVISMQSMASALAQIDIQVDRIVGALRKAGAFENTVFAFLAPDVHEMALAGLVAKSLPGDATQGAVDDAAAGGLAALNPDDSRIPVPPNAALKRSIIRRLRAGENDAAITNDIARLCAATPSDPAPFVWQGTLAASAGRHADAIAMFKRANDISPKTPYILSDLGLSLLAMGEIASGIDKLEDAYLNAPSCIEYRNNLATVLMNAGMAFSNGKAFSEAIACLSRVVYLQPDNPSAHVSMGLVYRNMGRADLAESCFKTALQISPNFPPALNALKGESSGDAKREPPAANEGESKE